MIMVVSRNRLLAFVEALGSDSGYLRVTCIGYPRSSRNLRIPRGARVAIVIMERKKPPPSTPTAFFSPTGLLKRGWNGVSSPINAMKDSMLAAAATPRSAAAAAMMNTRSGMPSPAEYPSLFDVRTPASTRASDGQSLRDEAPPLKMSSSRSQSRETMKPAPAEAFDAQSMDEEERAYLSVCHHNLHSVLTNPKANNWSDMLLDAFYLPEPDIPMDPFPGIEQVTTRDFEPYNKKFGKSAALYEENHAKPVSEQLSSSHVPSISVADGRSCASSWRERLG